MDMPHSHPDFCGQWRPFKQCFPGDTTTPSVNVSKCKRVISLVFKQLTLRKKVQKLSPGWHLFKRFIFVLKVQILVPKRYKIVPFEKVTPVTASARVFFFLRVHILKVPLLWVIKRFIFWFWESPPTGCKVKKHIHCLIICIYFYLICSTTPKRFAQRFSFQTPLYVMLICSDWSYWSHFNLILPVMPDKAAFSRAVLLCVQR